MKKKEAREVTVTYCDYCNKEITPPYSVVECKDGRKLDLCSDYIENGRNCLEKHKDFEIRQNEESGSEVKKCVRGFDAKSHYCVDCEIEERCIVD